MRTVCWIFNLKKEESLIYFYFLFYQSCAFSQRCAKLYFPQHQVKMYKKILKFLMILDFFFKSQFCSQQAKN